MVKSPTVLPACHHLFVQGVHTVYTTHLLVSELVSRLSDQEFSLSECTCSGGLYLIMAPKYKSNNAGTFLIVYNCSLLVSSIIVALIVPNVIN